MVVEEGELLMDYKYGISQKCGLCGNYINDVVIISGGSAYHNKCYHKVRKEREKKGFVF